MTNHPKSTETIRVANVNDSSGRWQPIVGPETLKLLENLGLPDRESVDRICDEAVDVLSQCCSPNNEIGKRTGLVIGYVQSGKTMSFTTVAALAHDNGFAMIIVIAGTSLPLLNQSETRLESDLQLKKRKDRRWKHLSNPTKEHAADIQNTLVEWRLESERPTQRQVILITVMKNHSHLRNLNELLLRLKPDGYPVLVIDDEADQAGLNTQVSRGGMSTTYRQLLVLRQSLAKHSYLQYTATPQAPLLINLIDVLSPEFAKILTPGHNYTGGQDFFTGPQRYVKTIPGSDISANPTPTAVPESLRSAMRFFLLGVADSYVKGETEGNRSMMVHPSHKTMPHSQYKHWVEQIRNAWQTALELPEDDRDRSDFLNQFRSEYDDLRTTVPDLAPFEQLAGKLAKAIRTTKITEINSAQKDGTPEVNWENDYSHILVGGQAMDRGFTVEGLTVSYMPRGRGVGNADTIQQRARFFGYKRSYLGYCRVYLENFVRDSFRKYVEHEEDIRARLTEHSRTGKPLSEWKRAFFLDKQMKPTRRSVLSLPYLQDSLSNEWFIPRAPHETEDAVAWNRRIIDEFMRSLEFREDDGHPDRRNYQRHGVVNGVSLLHVFENLLLHIRVPMPADSQRYTGLCLQVRQYLEDNPDTLCAIYQMSKGILRNRAASTLGENGLHQGAYPDAAGAVYPGDRLIHSPDMLTLQVHYLTVQESDGSEVANVRALAVWVPSSMKKDWLIQ